MESDANARIARLTADLEAERTLRQEVERQRDALIEAAEKVARPLMLPGCDDAMCAARPRDIKALHDTVKMIRERADR